MNEKQRAVAELHAAAERCRRTVGVPGAQANGLPTGPDSPR